VITLNVYAAGLVALYAAGLYQTGGYCRQGRSPRLGRALAGFFPSRS
jgi:hypothetical protein